MGNGRRSVQPDGAVERSKSVMSREGGVWRGSFQLQREERDRPPVTYMFMVNTLGHSSSQIGGKDDVNRKQAGTETRPDNGATPPLINLYMFFFPYIRCSAHLPPYIREPSPSFV